MSCVPALRKRLLDKSFWTPIDRDFGPAFYTTISFNQAVEWAINFQRKNPGELGCVIKIEVKHDEDFPGISNSLVFLSDTHPDWVRFIVDHRYECDERGADPCGNSNHPPIVVGPMADNKMDLVHTEYKRLGIPLEDKYQWYYKQITHSKEQMKLDSLKLGNQIAFCEEVFDELLNFESYYLFDAGRKEWIEYGKDMDAF